MLRRSTSLAAALVGSLMLFGSVRAGGPKVAEPIQAFAAVGCGGTYIVWVIFSNGKAVAINERSGITFRQLAEKLEGVPAEVRHFDKSCPLIA